MSDLAEKLGVSKAASTLLVLFITSHDPGVWRDDLQGGKLHFDEPVVIQCYTSVELLDQQASSLHDFLLKMGTEARQGAIGLVVDRDYLEILFPLPKEMSETNE